MPRLRQPRWIARSLGLGPVRNRRRVAAFTLVEVMMVVAIISLLAALALPFWQQIQRRSKSAVIANDFRVFAAAFSAYSQETGNWPADSAAGVLPAVMNQRIPARAFTRVTPMGGKYNWESNQTHFGTRYRAAISISAATGAPLTLDVNQLLDLERAIDGGKDADLLGGNFRIGTGLVPLFIIEQ
jgi:prepilin-type N-terminal cleavage/methylation domain-containing protein